MATKTIAFNVSEADFAALNDWTAANHHKSRGNAVRAALREVTGIPFAPRMHHNATPPAVLLERFLAKYGAREGMEAALSNAVMHAALRNPR